MVYTVFYKTSSFVGYCFLSRYSIHPQRHDVFSLMLFEAILVEFQICSFIAEHINPVYDPAILPNCLQVFSRDFELFFINTAQGQSQTYGKSLGCPFCAFKEAFMAKRYYWLKLKADWFPDKRIKKLRSIAGGDTHTIIYLKMMLLSLKDEGKLYFEGVEDNFASEIALALDEDAENVKLTLAFLQRHGLIEIGDDDEYQLTEVPTIIGSETASAMRVREHRERKNSLTQRAGCYNVTRMKQLVTI